MKPRCISIMDAEFFPEVLGPAELGRLQQIVQLDDPINGAQLTAHPADYRHIDLVVGSWGMPQLTAELLMQLPKLKAVFYAAGTIKFIATDASWERGIRITNASLANARPAAEFAFAEIILSLKRTWERIFLMREKRQFVQRDPLVPGGYGTTVGLLALGKIGRIVAEKLRTLDVNVIAYDPFVSPTDAAALGVRICSLPEVFAVADVVSCHLPSTQQTQHLLGRDHFGSMKRGSTFINTARGSVVREKELVAVLRDRPDIYAVLDVTEHEPPEANDPLFTLPNVVLTPHIAGSMGLECRRMGRMMVDEVERYLAGQPLLGEVLRDQLKTLA
jgi:phosphoglycerate dehydrogenase-like enzyme